MKIYVSSGTPKYRKELNKKLMKEKLGFIVAGDVGSTVYVADNEKKDFIVKMIESTWNGQLIGGE